MTFCRNKELSYITTFVITNVNENAHESRNKDYKNFQLHHSRKCSRSATNEDVFNRLLYTSDPFVSRIRKPYIKSVGEHDEDTLDLLKVHHIINDPEVIEVN